MSKVSLFFFCLRIFIFQHCNGNNYSGYSYIHVLIFRVLFIICALSLVYLTVWDACLGLWRFLTNILRLNIVFFFFASPHPPSSSSDGIKTLNYLYLRALSHSQASALVLCACCVVCLCHCASDIWYIKFVLIRDYLVPAFYFCHNNVKEAISLVSFSQKQRFRAFRFQSHHFSHHLFNPAGHCWQLTHLYDQMGWWNGWKRPVGV